MDVPQNRPSSTSKAERTRPKHGPNIKVIKKRKAEKALPEVEKRPTQSSFRRDTPNNTPKVARPDRTGVTKVFKHVVLVLIIDPLAIYQEFLDRGLECEVAFDDNRALLLIRLFFAIASPDLISQLRDACDSIRRGAINFNPFMDGIENIVRALDHLETTDHVFSIWRRHCLVLLSAKRFEIQNLGLGQRTRGQAL